MPRSPAAGDLNEMLDEIFARFEQIEAALKQLGMQRDSSPTGLISSGGSAIVTCAWPHDFADDQYVAVASVFEGSPGTGLRVMKIVDKQVGHIDVLVRNDSAGTLEGEVAAIAFAQGPS